MYFDKVKRIMANFIEFRERDLRPRGAQKGILPNREKIQTYCFESEYAPISLLQSISLFSHTQATLLYPGYGADILFPLLYMEQLFPQLKEAEYTFVDTQDNQKIIETVLDDIGIPFSRKKNRIKFYWNDTLVQVSFIVENVFNIGDSLPAFDIYFERAFRIMKGGHADYEQKIVKKLNSGGILISDSGFVNTSLKKIEVPKELSKYGEMVMGRKEK